MSALGFAVLFLAGTAITIICSVGRNASSIEARQLQAEAVIIQRRVELAALKRNRAMPAEAEGKVATNCGNSVEKVRKGTKATVAVYFSAVNGNLAKLKEIGPEVAADQTAYKIGKVVAQAPLGRLPAH